MPSNHLLNEANKCNPHGIGFAWVENGRVKYDKGWQDSQIDHVIKVFSEKPYPKAIHFRLATHGGRSMEMTHPFPITKLSAPSLAGTTSSVIFHNGVWTDYNGLLIKGIVGGTIPKKVMSTPMSDSRAMAVLAGNFGEDFLDLLDFTGEKVLLMKGDGQYYSYGHWYDGDPDENPDEKRPTWYHSNSWLSKAAKDESKKKTRSGYYNDWDKEKKKDKKVVPFKVETESTYGGDPSQTYLNMDREEVEAQLRQWNGHGGSND
jgi:hypothetical protein